MEDKNIFGCFAPTADRRFYPFRIELLRTNNWGWMICWRGRRPVVSGSIIYAAPRRRSARIAANPAARRSAAARRMPPPGYYHTRPTAGLPGWKARAGVRCGWRPGHAVIAGEDSGDIRPLVQEGFLACPSAVCQQFPSTIKGVRHLQSSQFQRLPPASWRDCDSHQSDGR